MSQYSLSTCDPLQPQKEDKRNARKPAKYGSAGLVIFETGTISTRAGSRDSDALDSVPEDEEQSDTCSPPSSDDGYPVTPTQFQFSTPTILGGVVVESPVPSRRGTMDEADAQTSALLPTKQEPSSPPDTPTAQSMMKTRGGRHVPPPLSSAALQGGDLGTPAPTPTTPSAPSPLSRAFGLVVKVFNR